MAASNVFLELLPVMLKRTTRSSYRRIFSFMALLALGSTTAVQAADQKAAKVDEAALRKQNFEVIQQWLRRITTLDEQERGVTEPGPHLTTGGSCNRVAEVMADNVRIEVVSTPPTGAPFVIEGLPAFRKTCDANSPRESGYTVKMIKTHFTLDPAVVIVEAEADATIIKTGGHYHCRLLTIFKVVDGKVTEIKDYSSPLPRMGVFPNKAE